MGQQVFRWFLRSEFSEENLEFWLACEEYRSTPGTQLNIKALRIYSQFINPEAPQEVRGPGGRPGEHRRGEEMGVKSRC